MTLIYFTIKNKQVIIYQGDVRKLAGILERTPISLGIWVFPLFVKLGEQNDIFLLPCKADSEIWKKGNDGYHKNRKLDSFLPINLLLYWKG